jgi:hypothetical protein
MRPTRRLLVSLSALVVLVPLVWWTGLPVWAGNGERSSPQRRERSTDTLLTKEYDLLPKYKKGGTRYYRLVILYKRLDQMGVVTELTEHRGDFQRVVESVEANGKAYEVITWKNVAERVATGDAGKFGAYKRTSWAEGFSYRFSAEDSYQDFHWNYKSFPPTREGYMTMILTVDAHFEFDFLRSSSHGSIEKLKRVGDEVQAPDNHQPFSLNFPPLVRKSHMQKNNVGLKFLGLTQVKGETCAIVAHRQGPGYFSLDFAAGSNASATMSITSSFWGNLFVRVRDGSLVHGDFIEQVRSQMNIPGQAKPVYIATQAEYNIEEISRETYLQGLPASKE